MMEKNEKNIIRQFFIIYSFSRNIFLYDILGPIHCNKLRYFYVSIARVPFFEESTCIDSRNIEKLPRISHTSKKSRYIVCINNAYVFSGSVTMYCEYVHVQLFTNLVYSDFLLMSVLYKELYIYGTFILVWLLVPFFFLFALRMHHV